jgi:hypothetical protein
MILTAMWTKITKPTMRKIRISVEDPRPEKWPYRRLITVSFAGGINDASAWFVTIEEIIRIPSTQTKRHSESQCS